MRAGVIALLVLSSLTALARERRENFNGVRGLGMGDSYVAVVNDETALAVNPAALGKLRDFYGTILDPELDISSRLPDLHRSAAFSQPTKIDDVMDTMLANTGTPFHTRFQMMPSFVARNFGIGFLMSQTLSGQAKSATDVDLFSRSDMSLLLGYNLRLWGGRIKFGFTGKVINRVELDEASFDPTAHALDDPSLAAAGLLREGTGVGADVGLMLTGPWTWLPTLAAVVRDVGGTPFDKASGMRLPDAVERPNLAPQDLDVGLSLSPIHSNTVRSVWTIEYRGLLTASNETDKAKLVHFGFEMNFGDVFFARAGYNQRYWTAGLELASESFQFQIASYGEEVGDESAPQEDRRVVGKAVFRF